MNGTAYLIISAILALLVIAVAVVFFRGQRPNRISPLAAIALAFVVAGITFGNERWIGYTFIGVGIVLAIADAIGSSRKDR